MMAAIAPVKKPIKSSAIHGKVGKRDGKREQEQYLDVKDQEENRVEIVMRFKLNPRVARRGDTAFVDVILSQAWFRRLEKPKP